MVEVGKIGDKTLVLDGRYISIFREGKLVWGKKYMPYALPDGNSYWYRRRVRITELSGNTLTDYQVKIEIGARDPIFAHARSAGEDIRFCYHPEEDILSYWIEKYDPDAEEAIIWVKVPEIPANSEIEIFMYYGNPEVPSASDGEATFLFFEDFEDDAVGEFPAGWSVREDASEIRVTDADAYSGTKCLRILDKGTQSDISYAVHDFPSQTLIAMDIAARIQANAYSVFGIAETIPDYQELPQASLELGKNDQNLYYGSDGTKVLIEADDLQWHEYTIIADTENYIKILKDGVVKVENKPLYASVTSWKMVVLKPLEGTFSTSYDYYYDLIRVRKYASPEPSVTVGAEE